MQKKKVLSERFLKTREQTKKLCFPLEIEDYVVQPHPDVSPPKWHLGHTSWFFEKFLLPHNRPFNSHFHHLFNSYYKSLGAHWAQAERGNLSRPTVKEIYAYRKEIDEKMLALIEQTSEKEFSLLEELTTLGIEHEKQHQELLVMDIKYIYALNPLEPFYPNKTPLPLKQVSPSLPQQVTFPEGTHCFGSTKEGFSYDNERPSHTDYLQSFSLCSHPVTNGQYLDFIEDGGYQNANFWYSDGWDFIKREKIKAPLYWFERDNTWVTTGLQGVQEIDPHQTLTHVSYFEASAYARWKGKRLPTEKEWERATSLVNFKESSGNFLETGFFQPSRPLHDQSPFYDLFGNTWEWTESSYSPYPGYRRLEGPLGEYNGKFMSGQMVLRGGSLATPRDHLRKTYRNFYRPEKRWCFSGMRLAEEA
jgi:ergothioneine biosynthesis protein EgtB